MNGETDPTLIVLVAHGTPATLQQLCELVSKCGHRPVAVGHGMDVLPRADDAFADLLLLAEELPGKAGTEVCRAIRQRPTEPWRPVLLMSERSGERALIHALSCGADDHLCLPASPQLLAARLGQFRRVLAQQKRLTHLTARQRQITEHIASPVLTLDESGCVLEANPAACQALGVQAPAALQGRPISELMDTGPGQAVHDGEAQLWRFDGSTTQVEVRSCPWAEGGRERLTLVLHDLTERCLVDRMRDEFLATVSHELRTPLTSILGAVKLVSSGAAGALPTPAQGLIDVAQRNGIRLGKLIDDILDITKLEGNRMELLSRPQPLLPLVQEALAANQGYAQAAGVDLRLVTQGLPVEQAGDVSVDADRFLQIMANLISNAVKHSPAGESVTVTLSLGRAAHQLRVADRGPGVPKAFKDRLFEKFAQATAGDSRTTGGTGLGLHIARLMTQRMGGRIWHEDGVGGVFGIEFPTTHAAQERPKRQVLVIEPDSDMRQRLERWLSPVAELKSFGSIASVPDSLLGHGPVIANPQGQGRADAFCTQLRRLAHGQPVLICSDSVDSSFAADQGFAWLAATGASESQLRAALARMFTHDSLPSRQPAPHG